MLENLETQNQPDFSWPSPRLIYHRRYNISAFGFERLHPFDSRKYGRAWKALRQHFGKDLNRFWVKPSRPINRGELLKVHEAEYLKTLRDASVVARLVEIPQLARLPGWLIDWCVLRPMRWGVMGTVVGAEEALEHGMAINLSGGYHHASPDYGHGFSAYADVTLALRTLRDSGKLKKADRVAYIDLDAHQGNGVARSFRDDSRVFIYDQYNCHTFPLDARARRRIDCDVPLDQGTHETDYLAALKARPPAFLDALVRPGPLGLGIYNAGSDIFSGDQLGGFNVSQAGILKRDTFVLQELISRRIPTLVLLSGGYSRESFQIIASMVTYALETWGGAMLREQ